MKRPIALFIWLLAMIVGSKATAQHTPLNPISDRVFTPFVINPAITGNKDFMALDLSATIQGTSYSQLLSGNSRIAKKGPRYFGAPVAKSFTRFGAGASLFNEVSAPSRNLGFSAATSFHLPLNDKNLSFFSGGIALKGIYNMMDSIPDMDSRRKTFLSLTSMLAYTSMVKAFSQVSQQQISSAI